MEDVSFFLLLDAPACNSVKRRCQPTPPLLSYVRLCALLVTAAISLLFLQKSYAQQSPHLVALQGGYQNGGKAFFETLANSLHYPRNARENGVMGLSSLAFKVDCNNAAHSFRFKTKLGYGIEEEIEATIKEKLTEWLDCSKRDSSAWMNIKIAFVLNDLYKSPDADFVITGHGSFPGVSDEQLLKDLEKAVKKGKDDDARVALGRLIARFPYNQDYKKQLIELNRK